jgi:uncharacterized protein YkwD
MRLTLAPVAAFAALIVTAACTTQTTVVSTGAPIPTIAGPTVATSALAVAPVAGSDAALFDLVNDFRAAQGRSPLATDAAVAAAARAHAQDMVNAGFFSHSGSNGSTVGTRLRTAGCDWTAAAENIAQGQTGPEAAMTTWINSAGHRANLLGAYTEVGAAQIGTTWVLVFAAGC